jgi:hypothetical protein
MDQVAKAYQATMRVIITVRIDPNIRKVHGRERAKYKIRLSSSNASLNFSTSFDITV